MNKTNKVLILTSDRLRHEYLVNKFSQLFNLVGVITQKKSDYYVEQKINSILIRQHFEKILETERHYFSNFKKRANLRKISVPDINCKTAVEFALNLRPDFIVLFGTGILKENWLKPFENKIINLHLGFSPFYRGSGTLFWPFYFGELEYLGTTIHLVNDVVDGGKVIGNIGPKISLGDDYYEITTKLIKKSIDCFPEVLLRYLSGELQAIEQPSTPSRICRKADFNEDALLKGLAFADSLNQKSIKSLENEQKSRCLY